MKTKEYKQNEFSACGAIQRPDYCFYPTNVCCFNCDNNRKCTLLAKREQKMTPCKPYMTIKMPTGKSEKVELFDKNDVCEFAL